MAPLAARPSAPCGPELLARASVAARGDSSAPDSCRAGPGPGIGGALSVGAGVAVMLPEPEYGSQVELNQDKHDFTRPIFLCTA